MNSPKEAPDSVQLKLISVSLKEAALDAPSFRASVNFFETKVLFLRNYLKKTVQFNNSKFLPSFTKFKISTESLINIFLPPLSLMDNGFISNSSNILSMLSDFQNDQFEMIENTLNLVNLDSSERIEKIDSFNKEYLVDYNLKRDNFLKLQTNYDRLSKNYQSIKLNDPEMMDNSKMLEEANNLFEARKNYLIASLDLVESISLYKLNVDRLIVNTIDHLLQNFKFNLKTNQDSFSNNNFNVPVSSFNGEFSMLPKIEAYFQDYRDWIDKAKAGSESLKKDITNVKQNLLDYTIKHIKPSGNLATYDIQSINLKTLSMNENEKLKFSKLNHSPEKAGWLFIKTFNGVETRWVRRWCFVQRSVFGIFSLSQSLDYVEETDKFGVMLTNVRYAPEEERKFCFEIKIFGNGSTLRPSNNHNLKTVSKDLSFILQAENVKELRSWMIIFEQAKSFTEQLNKHSLEYESAYKRTSPHFMEFACCSENSTDKALTSFDKHSILLRDLYHYDMSDYASLKFDEDSDKCILYQLTETPITTRFSQLAVIGLAFYNDSTIPNALFANVWGVTNWKPLTSPKTTKEVRFHEPLKQIPQNNTTNSRIINYPSYYPPDLRISDLYFRSIFLPSYQKEIDHPDELLLYKFAAFWCPNDVQRFQATCYLTRNTFYFYLNAMGFVGLETLAFEDLETVKMHKTSKNVIQLRTIQGNTFKIYCYFADIKSIVNKIQILIDNKKKDSEKLNDCSLLKKFKQIDKYTANKKSKNFITQCIRIKNILNGDILENEEDLPKETIELNKSLALLKKKKIEKDLIDIQAHRNKIQNEYNVTYQGEYEITSLGLLHILFGDKSQIFPHCFFFAKPISKYNLAWSWEEERTPKGLLQLVRKVQFEPKYKEQLLKDPRMLKIDNAKVSFTRQRIIKVIENRYYEIDQDPALIKISNNNALLIHFKFIISEPNHTANSKVANGSPLNNRSLLSIYYKLDFINPKTKKISNNWSFTNSLIENWVLEAAKKENTSVKNAIWYYLDRIGKNGTVPKAIRMCGLLGIAEKQQIYGVEYDADSIKELSINIENKDYDAILSFFTIPKYILLKIVLKTLEYLKIVIYVTIGVIYVTLVQIWRFDKTLALCLFCSVSYNMIIAGKSINAYWKVKNAETFFHDYVANSHGPDFSTISRALRLSDLNLLVKEVSTEHSGSAYEKFQEKNAAFAYIYQESKYELDLKRNDLLMELKMLQNREGELVAGGFRKFLMEELNNCNTVKYEMNDVWNNGTGLQNYCKSCENSLIELDESFLNN
ncbi:hypothetical protein TBLA_0I02320 [Henningerozyma blattae CBS 6284]|uniref:PH domain-containing protein n=1 Tax=Henningerozyma blattae (strain ATCC 34711 / CBS 6284 / DSM 70876 / NBRC 10599 / NRRL Y-10934 / UCD 77-7) TaxID=1071380 RepID=I2H938_HENB6|nr:hypothetical protein TBLA_0I02320 [Tetrapisispora blattae CBS 6284]CCH62890.1 hypothetical protein TBLA_0I02320 [Tetrapisispora blattae CBS 6284]